MKPSHSLDSLVRHDDGHKAARKFPAWLVPAAIIAGFAVLFAALFKDRLLPAPQVRVAVVLATVPDASEVRISNNGGVAGTLLFQASGWIEPDPLPIKATSLVDGVVESVHVLEGRQVAKGEVLASLIDIDAKLALEVAKNEHRRLQSVRAAHVASIQSARMKLGGAAAQVDSANTLRDEAADRVFRIKELSSGVIPESDVVSARLRLDREKAMSLAAAAGRDELESEVARLELETQVKDAEIAAAAIAVEQAALTLTRTKITSPVAGRVLRLLAAPGQKKMLQDNDPESSTIAILYEPDKLQVRVDVPLADAAGLQIGQAVRLRCSLLPDKVFSGEVTRITGEADLQRNTLQAKVRILDPVDQLRPEMLCRAEFLTSGNAGIPANHSGSLAMWIPENALGDGAFWVVDPESKRVSKRKASSPTETRDGFVRIEDGLRPGEQVVVSPSNLRDGQRVNPSLANSND